MASAISLAERGIAQFYTFAAGKKRCGATMASMERKVFWGCFILLGLLADFALPIWWALIATIPIAYVSWWVAYRSDRF
jgi:hypothetical protein